MHRKRPSAIDDKDAAGLIFSIEIVDALAFYVQVASQSVCETVASFLSTLVSPTSPLGFESQDQFIALNSHSIAVWSVLSSFFDIL